MIHLDNPTPLPHLLFEKIGPSGQPFDILVLRGTFDFADEGEPMLPSAVQRPLQLSDRYDGLAPHRPLHGVLAAEGDLVLGKPSTDIQIHGHAQCFQGLPRSTWQARFSIGPVTKALRFTGPRQLDKALLGWRLGEPEPISRIALDYRLAFGGSFYDPEPVEGEPASVSHPGNPAGCGWLPGSDAFRSLDKATRQRIEAHIAGLRQLSAPQIEDPQRPFADPYQHLQPQGVGPMPRWWQPRQALQGTLDARWQAERYPLPPEDFDPRFHQAAPPDLVAPAYLTGDEPVHLKGCLEEGERRMCLPGLVPLLACTRHDGSQQVLVPALDTLRLDLDSRQASLLWRLPLARHEPLARVSIGLVGLPQWQAARHRVGPTP
ncbi:hypothetical protein D3C85_473900 [compost metagenome]